MSDMRKQFDLFGNEIKKTKKQSQKKTKPKKEIKYHIALWSGGGERLNRPNR